jgi:hypothetical protein
MHETKKVEKSALYKEITDYMGAHAHIEEELIEFGLLISRVAALEYKELTESLIRMAKKDENVGEE